MNRARLDAHHDEYAGLLSQARAHLRRGRADAAAAYAQMAGQYAWMNHTGRFADPALEALLGELAARMPAPPRRSRAPSSPREVLHVVTQCYGTGGSTQAIASWVEQDAGRRHRVCITRQKGTPAPPKIVAPLTDPADLIRLDARRGGLMRRAARLRAIAAGADVVVLHLHPYDVVPAIALAGDGIPPVIYVDHCDHVFWLGINRAHVVMHMRESGRRLAADRRGLDPARSAVVARPLRPRGRVLARGDAKRALGLDPEEVLLVTAADGTKYEPVGSPSFLQLVLPVLERRPRARLLAAGPSRAGAWADAERRTGGRVRALGPLPDVRTLQEAADVYLDSFPFSSLTSLLEAGSLGVPAITYRGHPDECGVLGADTRGVDEHMLSPADPATFAAALDALIADPAERLRRGERTQTAILATHTGAGWLAAVEELYAQAAAAPAPAPIATPIRATRRLDELVDLVMTQTGFAQGVPGAVREHLALLPLPERLAAWRRLRRAGMPPPGRGVLPEWLAARLKGYRATVAARRQPVSAGMPSARA